MLAKLGNIFLNESRISKYKKLSFILFLAGVFMFISFPLLCNRIFIVEKMLKNANSVSNQFSHAFYQSAVKEYFQLGSNHRGELGEFFENMFTHNRNGGEKNDGKLHIHTHDIISPRGDRTRLIMFNVIYDMSPNSQKNSVIIYAFIKHLSIKENIMWLSKDIQFNFIQKENFYQSPNRLIERLTSQENPRIFQGQNLESVINIDITDFDFENLSQILIKINGKNSENVDMDYYKIFYDNLIPFFPENQITTVSPVFSDYYKFYLKNILRNIASIISGLFPQEQGNEIRYDNDFIYFLENMFDNFLLVGNKINANHLFISKGYNSLLIKLLKSRRLRKDDSQQNSKFTESIQFKEGFNFLLCLERVIKNISKNEIDLFRGEYHYLLCNSHSFLGIGFFLFIPVLCVIRIFYEVLDTIYTFENKTAPGESISHSKVISLLTLSFTLEIGLFLHIDHIKNLFVDFSYSSAFYLILLLVFVISLTMFKLMQLNRNEEFFIENIIRFFLALNCFNFIFINLGFGLLMTIIVMPLEYLITLLAKRQRTFLQIFVIGFAIYCVVSSRYFLNGMIFNFLNYMSNVYPLLCIVIILLFDRVIVLIIQKLNIRTRISQKLKLE